MHDKVNALLKAWPKNTAVTEADGHRVCVISLFGLETSEREKLKRDFIQTFSDTVSVLISHQADPHVYFRLSDRSIDYHVEDVGKHHLLRSRPYRMAERFRLDAEIWLDPNEKRRLRTYIQNIQSDPIRTLGPEPQRKRPDGEIDYTVLSASTRCQLSDNSFLQANDSHNCISWFSLAPVGMSGKQICRLLGMTEADIQKEAHSYTLRFSEYILGGGTKTRVPYLTLQSGEPLQNILDAIRSRGYLLEKIRLAPDAA